MVAVVALGGCGTMIASEYKSRLTPRAVGAIGVASGIVISAPALLLMSSDSKTTCREAPGDGSVIQTDCSYGAAVPGAMLLGLALLDLGFGGAVFVTNRYYDPN